MRDEEIMSKRPVSFAEKLQHERQKAGLSQYALAKQSGLSKQALSLLELGEREPSWATVQALARALGVSYTSFEVVDAPAATPTAKKKRK
jgi:transcriptional regulator with XRE-family HTH domain